MGRRSLISMTAIKRIQSTINRLEKEKERERLINSQGSQRERPPEFFLEQVIFNGTTRVAKIIIKQMQEYRTIVRYVTQDYVKYPIYSEWKVKQKTINKSIKLTNLELESLNKHSDALIRKFAEQIIIKINNEDLFPSWFLRIYLKKEYELDLSSFENAHKKFVFDTNKDIYRLKNEIDNYKKNNKELEEKISKDTKKKERVQLRLEKIRRSKPNLLKKILSLGIYCWFISEKRKQKTSLQLETIIQSITNMNELIQANNDSVNECNKKIDNKKHLIDNSEKEYFNKKNTRTIKYNKDVNAIHPLVSEVSKDNKFLPLKLFSGMEYEKIIGCYIIHNVEKDKYYVGQSKDVLRRLRQHFNGTVPKNIIFAEDYYKSSLPDVSLLFEVKIIKCKTKDELDKTEKKLIFDYDALNTGYNSTSGNE